MLPTFLQSNADRKKQITTLKIFNDNVREITKNTEYELPFDSGNNNLVLKVTLGNDFPKEKPVLTISPLVTHPWVNESGVITGAPGLLNFTPLSDLGRVVQAIIREFQRNPPALAQLANLSPLESALAKMQESDFQFHSRHSKSDQNASTSDFKLEFRAIPELNQLSPKDLSFLEECVDRQAEFIDELPAMKEQRRSLDDLRDQIKLAAEENVAKEEELTQSRKILEVRIEEAAKIIFENERLYSEFQALSKKYSPRNIQEELGKAAKRAEDESEKVAESFLLGELDVDKFLTFFIKVKSLHLLRKTKEEKLAEQLDLYEKEY